MRFETRYDTWLVAVLAATGLILFILPVALYSTLAGKGQPIWPLFIGPAIFVCALSFCIPQYYELREEGLYIRQGWKKTLLRYSAICELRIWKSPLSAPVFSTHRLTVTVTQGARFVIAVTDQERFLNEMARHLPQLEKCPSGLKGAIDRQSCFRKWRDEMNCKRAAAEEGISA